MNIDIERLREDLINYFGTALSYNPIAMMDLIKVENASDVEIIKIAENNNFDLNQYIIKYNKR